MQSLFIYFAELDTTPLPHITDNAQSTNIVISIINTALVILGSVAVLVIVLGGIRYIVSRGDPQTVNKAKNAILYAVIGLVIAMSASVIVNFVLRGL